MRRPLHNTTKLPRQLVDELAITEVHYGAEKRTTSKEKKLPGSRKERRKAERVQKKVQRREHHTQKPHSSNSRKESRVDGNAELANGSKRTAPQPVKGPVAAPKSILKKSKPARHDAGRHASSDLDSHPPSTSKGVRDKLAQDDADIAALEKKLGIRKKKKIEKNDDDGLDDILHELDGDDVEDFRTSAKRKRIEEDEWLMRKRIKAEGKAEEDDSQVSEVEDEEEHDTLSTASDDSPSEGTSDSEDHSLISGSSDDTTKFQVPTKGRENPYVPPTTASSKEAQAKYIPPSLRNPSSSEKDSLGPLRRQAQGILNRLSESNLVSILGDIERLYANNPRQHVTSTLVDLLVGVVCDRASLLDTFLILHAGLAAAIYKIIGVDFGASLVDRAVEEFDRTYVTDVKLSEGSPGSEKMEGGKKTLNLISLLAELYNLQVVGSHLIFDFIRLFLGDISEINTELLLRIIRSSGPQLRQDNPSALKDVVLLLQREISKLGEIHLSVRTRFMIETINDLKNNKLKTGAGPSLLRSQSLVNVKKTLGSLNSRKLQATEPLRISLRDIRNADKRGKWWLVGASWTKDDDNSEDVSKQIQTENDEATPDQQMDNLDLDPDLDFLQLAREQQMNTDIRRAIFIAIMSAVDYQDAYLRLTKLRLKRAQELEIPRVVIHCARAEQVYNPYYTLLARRLCADRKLKMAFQFSLWGLFKAIGERGDEDTMDADLDVEDEEGEGKGDDAMGMRKIVNMAKMYGSLIVDGALELTILKASQSQAPPLLIILNFAYLQLKTKTFVELLLVTVIHLSQRQIATTKQRDEKPLVDIFAKVKDHPSLARGLQFFLKTVVSKTDVAGGKSEKEIVKWGCRVAGNVLTGIVASVVVAEA